MKKKCLFIIPFFGKFNNYFQLFLNSCAENNDFNWLIVTDDETVYMYPPNVKVIYMSFDEFKGKVQSKFDNIKISLDTPYKLCDYKPAYGHIFSEYLENYLFWGHCDNDLIFGKLNHFLEIDEIVKYDKIGVLGHMTLYKNSKDINELFMINDRYKTVLTSDKVYKYDEEYGKDFGESINNIFKDNNKIIKKIDNIADIYVKSSDFRITNYNEIEEKYYIEKKDKSIFVWDKGCLYKYIENKKSVECKEYLYIHLQKRNMKIKNTNNEKYKIIPNAFENIENENFYHSLAGIRIKYFNLHYFKIRYKNLKTKLRKRRN